MAHAINVIIIGWINKGKPADCGETMKNQLLIKKLEELGVRCRQVDFKNWRKHPWVFLQLAWDLIIHKNDTIIFSTSTINVYPMMRLMYLLKWKQHTVHWVIGGSLSRNIKNKIFSKDIIGYMDWTIVESPIMKNELESFGIKNVIQLPNFKPIKYYPNIKERISSVNQRPIRFVFLSRIMPEKGCDYIFESAQILNKKGFQDKYSIDFYGKVAESYSSIFNNKLNLCNNVRYKGFLNLREQSGYDKLAQYDMMLFPTYWKGEGFAGVFIDAFISGVPLIASDWAHNRQFLSENNTAIFVPVHDVDALVNKMQECIEGKYDLSRMSILCQKQAETYNVDKVITKDLLYKIGILNTKI